MKAYEYNRIVKEYKKRVRINEMIAEALNDETLIGFYRQEREKDFARNERIIASLLEDIQAVKKEDIVYA